MRKFQEMVFSCSKLLSPSTHLLPVHNPLTDEFPEGVSTDDISDEFGHVMPDERIRIGDEV